MIYAFLVHSFVLALLFCRLVDSSGNLPSYEYEALYDLYNSTDGEHWIWQAPRKGNLWIFSANANPCADSWQGVTCTPPLPNQDRYVQQLELNGFNLVGTLPISLCNLTHLTELDVRTNYLEGTLPEWIGYHFPAMNALNLGSNRWEGQIPDSFVHLSNLTSFILGDAFMTGTLPAFFGQMHKLQFLDLRQNLLMGTIPPEYGNMTAVEDIKLDGQFLTGTIPSSLAHLKELYEFTAAGNYLTGTIPPGMGNLPYFKTFIVSVNLLTGTIPSTFRSLISLDLAENYLTGTVPVYLAHQFIAELELGNNRLTGPLPFTSFGNVSRHGMKSFEFNNNSLTGTIPECICQLTHLITLYLSDNMFTGTIPSCFNNFVDMEFLNLQNNALTGTIPPSMFNLSRVNAIWLSDNDLTGPVPDIHAPQSLTQLIISSNHLTGPMPNAFSNKTAVRLLNMEDNYLTGKIPDEFGHMTNLLLLSLSYNLLTGCIPSSFAKLRSVHELYLTGNKLGCNLDGVFSRTQYALSNVDVSSNQLTGTLPTEIFTLPKMTTFVALRNCFTGTLPPVMCNSTKIISLILDGMHTASSCRTKLLAATHSYGVSNAFYGTIPSCLFSMRTLSSLHLSGNSLSGTIPDERVISKRLVDLILSHNVLTGTIPEAVQTHNWRTLDLSYNRLSGTVLHNFGSDLTSTSEQFSNSSYNSSENSVWLKNNRLSGQVPGPLTHLYNVSVLGSNLFECDLAKSELPAHDNDKQNYQCGANAFFAPFFVVIAIAVPLIVIVGVVWRYYPSVVSDARTAIKTWYLSVEYTPRSVLYVDALSDILCQIALVCTALIVLVLVPWYLAASKAYGTYTHTYAWTVSAAFMSGVTPFAVEFCFYCALMVALVVIGTYLVVRRDNVERIRSRSSARISRTLTADSAIAVKSLSQSSRAVVYVSFLVINVMAVVGVNVAFVTVALTQSSDVLVLAQILVSLFKLVWNTVCVPFLIYLVKAYLAQSRVSAGFVTVQVFIALFNNITVPCLVVAVLSPSCFYNVFDAASPVTSTFVVQKCRISPRFAFCTFIGAEQQEASYDPPFRYDYQCSSSFITYYAQAYLYLAITAGLLVPVGKLLGLFLYQRVSPTSLLGRLLQNTLPRILRHVHTVPETPPSVDSASSALQAMQSMYAFLTVMWARYRPYVDANNHIIVLMTYLGILLTFGVVFPPLAVAMCMTMVSVTWQEKLALGRFLHAARTTNAQHLVDKIDQECQGAVSVVKVRRSLFAIICFSCTFYALFLFDTLGDAVGLHKAAWVLGAMPLFPVCIAGAMLLRQRLQNQVVGASIDPAVMELSMGDAKGIELGSIYAETKNVIFEQEPAAEAAAP